MKVLLLIQMRLHPNFSLLLLPATSWIRLNKGMKRQGIPRSVLPWTTFIQPYAAWAVICGFSVIVFFAGWTSLKPFSASDFFSTYVNIAFFFLLFVGWKYAKKTKWVSLDEMDCSTHYTGQSSSSLRKKKKNSGRE